MVLNLIILFKKKKHIHKLVSSLTMSELTTLRIKGFETHYYIPHIEKKSLSSFATTQPLSHTALHNQFKPNS